MQDNNVQVAATTEAAAATAPTITPEQRALLEKVQREEKSAKRKGFIKGLLKGSALVIGSAAAGAGLAYLWNNYSEQ